MHNSSGPMKHPLLSKRETYALIETYQQTDCPTERKRALDRLSEHNYGLIYKIALYYYAPDRPYKVEELVDEGWLGFKIAIDKFEMDRGLKLSTYATWWIKQSIARFIHQNEHPIRIPVHISELVIRIKTLQTKYLATGEPELSAEELLVQLNAASKMVVTIDSVRRSLKLIGGGFVSLDATYGNDDDGEGYEFLVSTSGDEIQNAAEANELEELIEAVFDEWDITPREAVILKMRFGLEGFNPMVGECAAKGDRAYTLQAVSDRLGITRERVRQIENEVLKSLSRNSKLRRYWRETMG